MFYPRKNVISATQLQYFDVYISQNSGELDDSNLCASANDVGSMSSSYPGIYRTIKCASGCITGRYIILRKKPRSSDEPILTLCDIKVIRGEGNAPTQPPTPLPTESHTEPPTEPTTEAPAGPDFTGKT